MSELPRFIGMVHLPPLPGSPRNEMSISACEEWAIHDALALQDGGADGLIIENFGDVPFRPNRVDAHTVAAMTRIGIRIRERVDIPVGINVLRNDALAALAIAQAIGAALIRVNILSGVMATDQGLITGEADELMRLRRALDATEIRVVADVLVKHAVPFPGLTLAEAIDDLITRGLADAIVVSGTGTGKPVDPQEIIEAVQLAGTTPVYVGSGARVDTIGDLVPPAYGAIVGTGLKLGDAVASPLDQNRVREFALAMQTANSN